jgi:hypothetical protein
MSMFAQLGKMAADNFIKQAALDPALANALGLGGLGAAAGGAIGSLSGLVAPGHSEEVIGEDEQGRKIIRKVRKNRLLEGLKQGLGGAAALGLGGAALGGLGTEGMRFVPKIQSMIRREQIKDNPLNPLGIGERLGLDASDMIWDALPREAQHGFMAQNTPQIYDNPLSRGANTVADKVKSYLGKK